MSLTDFAIERDHPLDLSRQIVDKLVAAMAAGDLVPGERLPSERNLGRLFGVSHMTVRKAHGHLVEQGFLVRRQPRGTFVASPEVLAAQRGQRRHVHYIGEWEFDFFVEATRGMSRELARHGLDLVLKEVPSQGIDRVRQLALSAAQNDAAGLVVYPTGFSDQEMSALYRDMTARRVPIVFIEVGGEAGVETVMNDNALGTALAVRHLYALGHRRLGYLDQHTLWRMQCHHDRRQGFFDACRDLDVPVCKSFVCHGKMRLPRSIDEAIDCFQVGMPAVLEAFTSLTGIVCYNDAMAIALWRAAEDAGLSVPGDLSIVGFDNRKVAQTSAYRLTTLDGRMFETGTLAARRLVRLIDQGIEAPVQTSVPPKLLVRGSTAPPPEVAQVCVASEGATSHQEEG